MINLSGSRLGQYEIHEEIGHGGMANVYRATQPSVGRTVAVKVLPAHFMQDRTFLERFTREVRVIAGLQHPHILPVHDYGEQEGIPYIVMAYMPGGSLADEIARSGMLALKRVVRLVEQIADALDYAHERGIVHRDFKPSNVLLDTRGNPYLADFGIAKVTEATAQLTGSGMVGTPAYMAPEMSRPGGVTPQIDVYALGVTLFQMLTGRAPYEADTPMGVLVAHATEPIPDVRQHRSDLPDGVQTVIERAMAKDPAERYAGAGELADDLREAAAGGLVAKPVPVQQVAAPFISAAPETTVPDLRSPVRSPAPPYVEEAAAPPAKAEIARKPAARKRRMRLPVWIGTVITAVVVVGVLWVLGQGIRGEAPNATEEAIEEPAPGEGQAPIIAGADHIAFVSDREGNHEIYLMDPDGSNVARLTNNPARDTFPAWSFNGEQIAFTSDRFGDSAIYIMKANGSNPIQVKHSQGALYPAWSPDGRRIAFAASQDGNFEIFTISINGSNRERLISRTSNDIWPVWSPDGNRIAFASYVDYNWRLYIRDSDKHTVVRVTDGNLDDRMPAWSPDGQRFAFAASVNGRDEIFVIGADGSNRIRLTNDPADDSSPAWSPDGTKIVFVSNRDGNDEIYMMNADGSNLIRLTDNPAADTSPAWQP